MSGGPLAGLRVIDAGVLFAAPLAGTLLGDFGAEVVKVEHPRGDPLRAFGWQADGESLWWQAVGRNKRSVLLDLSGEDGQHAFRALAASADIVLESFRPGTLERWDLGYERLTERNPGLILLRMSGFGQTGPYRERPGYGTLAEAMSGFAAITGEPEGPPTLPPVALADSVAALAGAFSVLAALFHRERTGTGQVIDVSLLEPLIWMLGAQATMLDRLGAAPERTGNRTSFTAPRNLYRSADDRWLALSASSQTVAERVLRLVGGEQLRSDPRFATNAARLENIDALDAKIGSWVGSRTLEEALRALEDVEAAAAPVYDAHDLVNDDHLRFREAFVRLDGTLMQGLIAKLSDTPGSLRRPAPRLGEHSEEVLREAGLDGERLERLLALEGPGTSLPRDTR